MSLFINSTHTPGNTGNLKRLKGEVGANARMQVEFEALGDGVGAGEEHCASAGGSPNNQFSLGAEKFF